MSGKKVPGTLPKGIMAKVGKHLKWVDDPFDASTMGKLKADVAYSAGKRGPNPNYAYTTDAKGRLASAHAYPLSLDKGRGSHSRNPAGKRPGDQAGHLIADVFGGSGKLDNIVSQSRGVNQGDMRKLERKWQKGLEKTPPDTINVDIEVKYGKDGRPSGFMVFETINGKPQTPVRFDN